MGTRVGHRVHQVVQPDGRVRAPTVRNTSDYRVVYQSFHGSRDVLLKLRADPRTAVLPFDYPRVGRAERVVVEACPASWLKARGWPHHSYKQPAGGRLAPPGRAAGDRHGAVGAGRAGAGHVRAVMRNPGADALDAVLAGYAAFHGCRSADHGAIARHPRYPREGRAYVDCAAGCGRPPAAGTVTPARARRLDLPAPLDLPPIQKTDVQIAAIALTMNCTLVTGDGDFAAVPGLRVESWAAGA